MTTPTQFSLPSSNFNAIQHQQLSQQKYHQEVVSMAAAVSVSNSPNSSPSSSSSQQYLVQQQMFSQQNQQHHQTSLTSNQPNSDIADSYQYTGIRNSPTTSNSFPTSNSFITSENTNDHTTNETAAPVTTTIDSMRDQKIFTLPQNNSSLPETFSNSNSTYVTTTNYNLKNSRRLSTPIEIEHDTSHVGSHRVRSQTLPLYQNGNTAAAYQSQQQHLAHITDMNPARYSAASYSTSASSFLTLDRRTVNSANVPILPILQPFSSHSKIVQLPPPIDVGVTENASEPWRTINGLVMPDNNAPTSLQLGLHAQKHKAFDDTMSRTTVGAIDPVFTTHDPVAMKPNNNNISNTMPSYYNQPQGYDRNIHQGNIPPTMSNNPDYSIMSPRFTPNGNVSPTMSSNGNKPQAQAAARPPPVPAPAAMMTTFSSKTVSSTPKRYKCTICQKRFTRPSSLQTHMYSHTGEKPFKCPVEGCGRHFSVVSNLRRHQKIHAAPP